MLKKSIISICVLFVLIGLIYIFYRPPTISTNINSIKITTLPAPPKTTTITDLKDIKKFIQLINTMDSTPIFYYSGKGWKYHITFKNTSITILDNKIKINYRWYKVKNIEEKFKKYYENLN